MNFISGFDARWQPVNGTRHKFYVYSAYYDARTRPVIRVIGATKTKRSDKVWCRLHYGQNIEQKVSKSGNGNENVEDQEEGYQVTCPTENFLSLKQVYDDHKIPLELFEMSYLPKNETELEKEKYESLEKMISLLEDNDDIQNVYSNADFTK